MEEIIDKFIGLVSKEALEELKKDIKENYVSKEQLKECIEGHFPDEAILRITELLEEKDEKELKLESVDKGNFNFEEV